MKERAYGIRPRTDGREGRELMVESGDPCLDRVAVYDGHGKLVRTYLEDKMGVPFMDNLDKRLPIGIKTE